MPGTALSFEKCMPHLSETPSVNIHGQSSISPNCMIYLKMNYRMQIRYTLVQQDDLASYLFQYSPEFAIIIIPVIRIYFSLWISVEPPYP